MKIYEYNYKNNNLPAKLKTINANYDHGSSDNLPIQKFLYNNILDFQETLPQEIFKDCVQKFNEIKAGNNN